MMEYDYRGGTGENYGFDFEDQMIAYSAVAACNCKDLEDFWIAGNVDGLGAWDDVTICTETKTEKKLQIMQLKHKANVNSKPSMYSKVLKEINKYVQDFEEISSLMSYAVPNKNQYKIKTILTNIKVPFDNVDFIFICNSNLDENFNSVNSSAPNNYKLLPVPVPKSFFFMTNPQGAVFKLNSNLSEYTFSNNFANQFFIVSEQSGVDKGILGQNIEEQLKQFIDYPDFKGHSVVAKQLPNTIKGRFLSNTEALSFTIVKEIIYSGILSALNQTKPINTDCSALNEQEWSIFQELIANYRLVIFSYRDLMYKNFFDAGSTHFFITCEKCDIDFVINCLKTAESVKVVLFVPNESRESISRVPMSTLNLLKDLSPELLDRLNNYKIKIQGRDSTFGILLRQYPDINGIFTVDDILKLLSGKLNIGESNNFNNYYVPRSMPKIFLNKLIIFEIPTFLFIVIVESDLAEATLKINSYLESKAIEVAVWDRSVRNNETRENNFLCVKRNGVNEARSKVNGTFKSVHILKYHEDEYDFQLEWLSSDSNIQEIKQFIAKENKIVEPIKDNYAEFCSNSITRVLVVANPGMGKSYLTKHWAHNYPVDSWAVEVILNEIVFTTDAREEEGGWYCDCDDNTDEVDSDDDDDVKEEGCSKVKDFQSYLELYTKTLSPRDKKIFDLYLNSKFVVMFFDGFDEVYNEEKALMLINEAIGQELKVVVTSREVTKYYLEENLNVLAYTLNPFSNDDKTSFFENFYLKNIKKLDSLALDVMKLRTKEFGLKLVENCALSNWDEEFTGVPLQCRLLAEGFVKECQRYCDTGITAHLPKNLNLIKLYEHFIKEKFNIYIKEKEELQDTGYLKKEIIQKQKIEMLENHLVAAVKIIFPKVEITITRDFLREVKGANHKYGIITGVDKNNLPVFIHRTFAEYFAAIWLIRIKEKKAKYDTDAKIDISKREEYLKFLLEPQYNVVHDLFDKILCKKCDLHIAIGNRDAKSVQEILEKRKGDEWGKCGRSALHLISSKGAKHEMKEMSTWEREKFLEIERIEDEKYLDVLNILLEKGACKDTADELLHWTPQQYANHRNAFGVIDKLLQYSQLYNLENSPLNSWKNDDILIMCAKYDYVNIATNIVDIRTIERGQIESLLEICAKYDSVKLVEKIIQCKELNSQDLTEMGNWGVYKLNETLLHVAAGNRSMKTFDVFLKYIDVNIKNDEGTTVLHIICSLENLSVVKALMDKGALLFIADDDGETPVDTAISRRNEELVQYLTSYDVLKIEFGDDINATLGSSKRTALHYAVKGKNISTFQTLISEKADGNVTDGAGQTALHYIFEGGWFDANIVRRLVESGLRINIQDVEDRTALHLAAADWYGNKEGVKLLLELGANPNIRDNEHRTSLNVARETNNDELFLIIWDWESTLIIDGYDIEFYMKKTGIDVDVDVRRKTFDGHCPEWLTELDVDSMAQAGLYYKDYYRGLMCFKCGCELTDWNSSDNPWVKHARKAPTCEFLIREKGEEFIQMCQ